MSLVNSKIKHVIITHDNTHGNECHVESVIKNILEGSDVIDQFMLPCQSQAPNLSSKFGGVTHGSVQVNASGGFLVPGAIICNPRSNPSNSDSIMKKLDSIPIKLKYTTHLESMIQNRLC